jgi:hypothetical protein
VTSIPTYTMLPLPNGAPQYTNGCLMAKLEAATGRFLGDTCLQDLKCCQCCWNSSALLSNISRESEVIRVALPKLTIHMPKSHRPHTVNFRQTSHPSSPAQIIQRTPAPEQ